MERASGEDAHGIQNRSCPLAFSLVSAERPGTGGGRFSVHRGDGCCLRHSRTGRDREGKSPANPGAAWCRADEGVRAGRSGEPTGSQRLRSALVDKVDSGRGRSCAIVLAPTASDLGQLTPIEDEIIMVAAHGTRRSGFSLPPSSASSLTEERP